MPVRRGVKPVAQNRKARHDYFIEETLECGIELFGTEVKSLRNGACNLKEARPSFNPILTFRYESAADSRRTCKPASPAAT